jgi:hypothetical protein
MPSSTTHETAGKVDDRIAGTTIDAMTRIPAIQEAHHRSDGLDVPKWKSNAKAASFGDMKKRTAITWQKPSL